MDGLRWLLLLFGLLVILGVYLYSRREQARRDDTALSERRAPTLNAVTEVSTAGERDAGAPELAGEGPAVEAAPSGDQPKPGDVATAQKIVALRVVARDGGVFAGDELIVNLRGIGMRHGKFGIFHRLDGSDEERSIFSAASLVEPGSFDLANIKQQKIPGISLFLVLPGPVEGTEAFDLMMAAARTLAQSLDAELLDESGSSLSIQRERYLREEIVQFEHSNKVA